MLVTPDHDGRTELQIRGEDVRGPDCHTRLEAVTVPSLKPELNAHALVALAGGNDDRISHQAPGNRAHEIFRPFLRPWSSAQ